MSTCSTNYVCTPVWYVAADDDVIAYAAGPHAVDLNVTCVVKTGNIQFQMPTYTQSQDEFKVDSVDPLHINPSIMEGENCTQVFLVLWLLYRLYALHRTM